MFGKHLLCFSPNLYIEILPSPRWSYLSWLVVRKLQWIADECNMYCRDIKARIGETVRIYSRKQESKKRERKHALNQETDQESVKKKVFFFLSWLLSWSSACFLSFFLNRYHFFIFSWSCSCFLCRFFGRVLFFFIFFFFFDRFFGQVLFFLLSCFLL